MTTNTTKNHIGPANARTAGARVRKALKALGLDWKVKCAAVSFGGLGYGSVPFATIAVPRRLTYIECSALAETLRELREDPDGGKAVISLHGPDYAFGGAIHAHEYPLGAAFWNQLKRELVETAEDERKSTAVIKESARRVLLAYRAEGAAGDPVDTQHRDAWCKEWVERRMADPESQDASWPDIYTESEKPEGWPGIMAFEGEEVHA